MFSYNLLDDELEKEIKIIDDKEVKAEVRRYLDEFSISQKEVKKENEKLHNIQNWNDVIKVVNEDIDKAYLYIDYSSSKENINAKKQYISQIKRNGHIITDKVKFLDLFSEFIEKNECFKQKDISNYRNSLSIEDFKFFENLQFIDSSNFEKIIADYKYISRKIKEIDMKKNEDKYDFIKLLFSSKEDYKKINKKEADLKARNEIIDLIISRYKEK